MKGGEILNKQTIINIKYNIDEKQPCKIIIDKILNSENPLTENTNEEISQYTLLIELFNKLEKLLSKELLEELNKYIESKLGIAYNKYASNNKENEIIKKKLDNIIEIFSENEIIKYKLKDILNNIISASLFEYYNSEIKKCNISLKTNKTSVFNSTIFRKLNNHPNVKNAILNKNKLLNNVELFDTTNFNPNENHDLSFLLGKCPNLKIINLSNITITKNICNILVEKCKKLILIIVNTISDEQLLYLRFAYKNSLIIYNEKP